MQANFPYNIGPKTVTIYGPEGPVSGVRSPAVLDAIRAGDLAEAIKQLTPIGQIAAAFAGVGDVVLTANNVLFKGRAVNNASAERILELARLGLPVESEVRCLASLMRHDDARVIEAFEDFVQRWNIPRTSDGRIVLCKGVRGDFMDLHTGRVNWSVGETVRMAWADVDRDPANTCSRGLHAAPLEGARAYMSGGRNLIELYIWPEHIAALPYDYQSCGKVRVVEAYVSRVIPEEIAANYYDLTGPLVDLGEDESEAFNPDGAFDDGEAFDPDAFDDGEGEPDGAFDDGEGEPDAAELSAYAAALDQKQFAHAQADATRKGAALELMTPRAVRDLTEECESPKNAALILRAEAAGVRFAELPDGTVYYIRPGGYQDAQTADALANLLRTFWRE